MIELIKQLLQHPAGSFGFVFSLLTLSFFLVYWITKKVTEIKASHDKIESSVDGVYKRIDVRVDKIESHIDNIRKDISFLKAMIDVFQSIPIKYVAKRESPVSLTDLGKEISEKLKAEEMVSKNWDKIFNDLELNVGDKNAYDIQKYCLETSIINLSKFINESDVDSIKMHAFNEGNPLAFYAPIFAIIIRDKYLEIKEIDVLEIDKHEKVINTT
jgi:hypothetical protein